MKILQMLTSSIPYTVLAELKKQEMELYIEFLKEELILQKHNTVKNSGLQVLTLLVNALKSIFNSLTEENETDDGESYFYWNVMSKIVKNTSLFRISNFSYTFIHLKNAFRESADALAQERLVKKTQYIQIYQTKDVIKLLRLLPQENFSNLYSFTLKGFTQMN